MRYFIEIAYSGKNYHGWQNQPNSITVQGVLENSLSTILRTTIKVMGAGRTDAGVHAKQLFAHFDYSNIISVKELIFKLNSFLANDITVLDIFQVKDDMHARFSAIEREYQYVVSLEKNPFIKDFSYQIHQNPNIDLMNQAANELLNYKDFQCFSRSNTDVKTYYCDVKIAIWEFVENQLVFTIRADRFLRNMVRVIVGTLLDVGFEKTSLSEFHQIIKSKDRTKAGTSAPARGLCLTKVMYPKQIKN